MHEHANSTNGKKIDAIRFTCSASALIKLYFDANQANDRGGQIHITYIIYNNAAARANIFRAFRVRWQQIQYLDKP